MKFVEIFEKIGSKVLGVIPKDKVLSLEEPCSHP